MKTIRTMFLANIMHIAEVCRHQVLITPNMFGSLLNFIKLVLRCQKIDYKCPKMF